MDKRYLLTYYKEASFYGISPYSTKTYEWFEDEDEMNDFIEANDINPIEKLHIIEASDLK